LRYFWSILFKFIGKSRTDLCYLAHFWHLVLSGIDFSLPYGISAPHRVQVPNIEVPMICRAYFNFIRRCMDCRRAASLTLLLLIASILETRPMAFSGATGLISSSSSRISDSTFLI